jgi:hypothetical protein
VPQARNQQQVDDKLASLNNFLFNISFPHQKTNLNSERDELQHVIYSPLLQGHEIDAHFIQQHT